MQLDSRRPGIKQNKTLKIQLSVEIYGLLCRLFNDTKIVLLRSLTPNYSIDELPDKLSIENAALAKSDASHLNLYKIARMLVSQNSNKEMNEYYIALL